MSKKKESRRPQTHQNSVAFDPRELFYISGTV